MNYSKRFVVEPGAKVKLHKMDPGYIDPDVTEKDALAQTKKLCKKLRKLQASLYCEKQRSVLIVLQALDTAGKDGVINHVLGAMNPLSCRVASFKKPGPEAAAQNYLWRVSIFLPEKGEVVIFNRSHYEDVLVTRVHNLVLEDHLVKRYHQLNSFEHFLTDNDTHVLKFFLHISKEEQLQASSGGSTTRIGIGRSATPTTRSASSGTPTSRPTRQPCPVAAPSGRPGTSSPPTASGFATSRWPELSWTSWKGSRYSRRSPQLT
jgi:hypothetical protein